ncbi:spore germination protein [Paenibacillus barengoltzii]|uniref:GerA spore germination protein n=1 Tax=Paenibacillus barengoltzii J12 TaxID=935846 RepID=A0ABY1M1J2_9BACL|nr:spore germination protein [Paenibacillus barengoltzii]SMF54937.1 GerA spore germination protein [Paenibacillus barengoltzii J12]
MNASDRPSGQPSNKIDIPYLINYFQPSSDVKLRPFTAEMGSGHAITLIYCEPMTDLKQLNEVIYPRLADLCRDQANLEIDALGRNPYLPLNRIEESDLLHHLTLQVYSGRLVLYFEHNQTFFSCNISNPPGRSPEEASTESAVKGARDGFTENLSTNIGLIRKRLRTASLGVEEIIKGTRGETRIALFYIRDVINPDILEEARKRLNEIDTDAIIGTSYLESIVKGAHKRAIFPLTDYSGRPDYVADALLAGRFAVLADGNPIAIVAPVTMMNLLISPEDANNPYYIVSVQKVLRLIGLAIGLFLPGFYVALTSFNLEQIPVPLLATISKSRHGLPFPIPFETFMMLFLFEIFNEAGKRLPQAIGQTITVVGGLIIGDAAIRAGITSPTIIVTAAISIVASSTLENQTLSGTTSQLRILILLLSSIFGMFGFLIGFIGLILYLASLESYGVPYLSPFSPFVKKDFAEAVLKKPSNSVKHRPRILRPRDQTARRDKP